LRVMITEKIREQSQLAGEKSANQESSVSKDRQAQ
jgi:hypothetical protein